MISPEDASEAERAGSTSYGQIDKEKIVDFSQDSISGFKPRARKAERLLCETDPHGRYHPVQNLFAAHGGDHELTAERKVRVDNRVLMRMVHRDRGRKPDGDAKSGEAEKPSIDTGRSANRQ